MGITVGNEKGLVSKQGLTKLFFGRSSKVAAINLAIKEKKLISAGMGMVSGTPGIVPLFKKISKSQLKKILKIDFFEHGEYLTLPKLSSHLNVFPATLKELIKEKKIKPVGVGIGATKTGRIKLFKKYSEKEFCKLIGIDFIRKPEHLTLRQLSRYLKIGRHVLRKLEKNKLIKPLGLTLIYGQKKAFPVYEKLQRSKIIRTIKDNKKLFFNFNSIKFN